MLGMEALQYPARPTIKAFGGLSAMGEVMGLNRQNIDRWLKSPTGMIPRWWTAQVEAAAKAKAITLPAPRTAKKRAA